MRKLGIRLLSNEPWTGLGTRVTGRWYARRECRSNALRREALDHPRTTAFAAISQPIVQAIRPSLPELHGVGHHAQAAPLRRARDPAGMALAGLGEGPLELIAGGEDPRLRA